MPGDERDRVLSVRARFGLPLDGSLPDAANRLRDADRCAGALDRALAPGGVALITGPSGSGKSLILGAFAARTAAVRATPVSPAARRPPVAMIGGDLDRAIALLAAVGLGEARRLVTPAGLLSEGERARLSLARAIAKAGDRRDVACDEFTSTLDRLTARSLCRCVRRALPSGTRLVCATSHDDILPHLNPDVVIAVPLAGPPVLYGRSDGRDAGQSLGVA